MYVEERSWARDIHLGIINEYVIVSVTNEMTLGGRVIDRGKRAQDQVLYLLRFCNILINLIF